MGISGLLGFLGNAAPYAANTLAARNNAQAEGLKGQQQQMMQMLMLQQQQKAQAVKDALAQAQIGHYNAQTSAIQHPLPKLEKIVGPDGTVQFVDPTKPPPGLKAAVTPHGPVMGSPDWLKAQDALAVIKEKHHPPPQPDRTLVITQGPDGQPVYTRRGDAAGQTPGKIASGTSATLAAPMAAKVGQFGEMLKKADDLVPAMEALDVALGSSAANDLAQRGFHHIPGTEGIGSYLVNKTPEYSRYQAALSPFILAAAHALSGARINQDQVTQIRHSIEIKPGDTPEIRNQKRKNIIDLINSIGGGLPPDAVAAQEQQMGEGLSRIQGYGYQPSGSANTAIKAVEHAGQPKAAKFDPDAFYELNKRKP